MPRPMLRGLDLVLLLRALESRLTLAATPGDEQGKLPAWEELLPQHGNDEHLRTRPRTRYSHTATLVGSEVVVAHGYFYNHNARSPTLLADVWAFSDTMNQSRPGWRLVTDGDAQSAPPARMSHIAVSRFNDVSLPPTLILFGGETGVSTAQSGDTKLQDLWSLDVKAGVWSKLESKAPIPGRRHSFTGVMLDGALVIYGGHGHAGETYGDLWRFDFQKHQWKLLIPDATAGASPDHPGARASHCAVQAPNGKDMYVYGGHRKGGRFHGRMDDLWLFKGDEVKWLEVPQGNSDGGRSNFAIALYPSRLEDEEQMEIGLVTFAGSQCDPKCRLTGSLSFFSLHKGLWYSIPVLEEPYTRYKHDMVVYNGSLLHFGGESYTPYMYHNSVNRIALSSIPSTPRLAFDMPGQEM